MVQREQDGVGDGCGAEELEDMMAVQQQDGDGRLLSGGLTVPDQVVMERRRDTGNTSAAVGLRDPRAVHPVGRSRLVLPTGSAEQAGHVGEIRPAPPNQLGKRTDPGRRG